MAEGWELAEGRNLLKATPDLPFLSFKNLPDWEREIFKVMIIKENNKMLINSHPP